MCAVCMISVYIFARSLLFFYPPSLLPPMQFSALCKQKSAAKKKRKKKKRIVSLSKNFDRFFLPSPTLTTLTRGQIFIDSFFLLVLSFDTRKLASINSRTESIIPSGIWFVLLIGGGGRKMGAQSLTEMPVLFVQPTLNEICTVYSLSRGKWR